MLVTTIATTGETQKIALEYAASQIGCKILSFDEKTGDAEIEYKYPHNLFYLGAIMENFNVQLGINESLNPLKI